MTLSELGGSPKTYRVADNLTIGYRNFSDIPTIWEQELASDPDVMEMVAASDELMDNHARTDFVMDAVSTSATAMDAVSTSATAMDAVSTSATAMDAVSMSQTARDAIGTSGVGYDAIAAVAMAIGKYAAGIAGLDATTYAGIDEVASSQTAMDAVSTSATAMDAVSTSATAMDAVSASQTAMQSVMGSTLARTALLGSEHTYTSPWSTTTASEEIWLHAEPDIPFTIHAGTSKETEFRFGEGPHSADGQAIVCDVKQEYEDYNSGDNVELSYTLDVDGFSDLLVYTEITNDNGSGYVDLEVDIDGTNVFSTYTTHNWTERSFGLGDYSGEVEVVLRFSFTRSSVGLRKFGSIKLV